MRALSTSIVYAGLVFMDCAKRRTTETRTLRQIPFLHGTAQLLADELTELSDLPGAARAKEQQAKVVTAAAASLEQEHAAAAAAVAA